MSQQNPEKLYIYGAHWCHDTQRTRRHLDGMEVPYEFVDVDEHPRENERIAKMNGGRAKLPTVVFGEKEEADLIEPSDDQLDELLRERGLLT